MKTIRLSKFPIVCFFAFLLFSSSAFAGTKGKIAGKVVDEDGEPLVGVQVFIEGTTRGTVTDVDGLYSLIKLDPETYTVVFRYVGFATTKMENVEVIVDRTTEVNITLVPEIVEGQEIIITAERPIVEKDRTTTTAYISSQQLEDLPLVSINEAINQQAGIVDGHFRGGRTGEVSYLVNGVPINNAYNNSAAFEVEQNMVAGLEVISGVFNAEYGQAMSGVVNIVTKGVSSSWTANALAYTGTIVSNRELEFVARETEPGPFLSSDDFIQEKVTYSEAASDFASRDVQFSVGGPIINDKLGIKATLRYVKEPGHLIGRDLFRPSDQQFGVLGSGDPETWLIESTGSGDFEELNYHNRYSLNTTLVYEVNSRFKLDYNAFLQRNDGRNYDHNYKYNPNGINKYYNDSQNHILGLRYSIGQKSYANLSYSFLIDQGESKLHSDARSTEVDSSYVSAIFAAQGESAFNMGGNYLFSSLNITRSHTFVGDFTSQVSNVFSFKSGLSGRFHFLDNESFGILVPETTGIPQRSTDRYSNSRLEVSPYELAAYTQAKIELEDLIVNAGLRFDYFDPDFVVPVDLTLGEDEVIPDPDDPSQTISNRKPADKSYQLSPRLGIAFPISETGVMRFSAGMFFQTPQLSMLYQNNEFEIQEGVESVQFGNANIKAERTLAFEVGLQQGLSETMGFELTLYSKDIRDLTGLEITRESSGRYINRFVNLDYGTVKGGTLSLFQRGAGNLSWTLDYTLQFATGSASDPQESFQRQQNGYEPIIKLNRLDWDRRNVLNNTITWNTNIGLTISAINSLQSGTPYTPIRNFVESHVPNNQDKPIWFNSDARMYYKPLNQFGLELFLQVDNIFDTKPHWNVYNDTGLGDESTELFRKKQDGGSPGGLNSFDEFYINQSRFGPPRTIKIGLSYKI